MYSYCYYYFAGRFCGSGRIQDVIVTGNSRMLISFMISDKGTKYKGFTASYEGLYHKKTFLITGQCVCELFLRFNSLVSLLFFYINNIVTIRSNIQYRQRRTQNFSSLVEDTYLPCRGHKLRSSCPLQIFFNRNHSCTPQI